MLWEVLNGLKYVQFKMRAQVDYNYVRTAKLKKDFDNEVAEYRY